jgi:hypothetical protein
MVMGEDLVERLARTIHEHYLAEQVSKGTPTGSNRSLVAWDHLDEDLRQANRGQAGHIGRKLELINAALAPRTGPAEPFEFTTDELERLAELEHERWAEERQASGWRYAPVRDDEAKHHDLMVEWSKLTEEQRDKDREAVRNLPAILAEAGLRVVRL